MYLNSPQALVAEGHEIHLFTRSYEDNDEIISGVHYHGVACDQYAGIVEQMNRMCDSMYCPVPGCKRERWVNLTFYMGTIGIQ